MFLFALEVWYRRDEGLSTGFLCLWARSTKKSVLSAWLVTVSVSFPLCCLVYLKACALYSGCWGNSMTIGLWLFSLQRLLVFWSFSSKLLAMGELCLCSHMFLFFPLSVSQFFQTQNCLLFVRVCWRLRKASCVLWHLPQTFTPRPGACKQEFTYCFANRG